MDAGQPYRSLITAAPQIITAADLARYLKGSNSFWCRLIYTLLCFAIFVQGISAKHDKPSAPEEPAPPATPAHPNLGSQLLKVTQEFIDVCRYHSDLSEPECLPPVKGFSIPSSIGPHFGLFISEHRVLFKDQRVIVRKYDRSDLNDILPVYPGWEPAVWPENMTVPEPLLNVPNLEDFQARRDD
ncbi:hypothetical protein ACN47E_001735 [Coniothyrium glycines]